MKNVKWKLYYHKKGYTLIELIFSISIFAILILCISSLLKISFKSLDFAYSDRRLNNNYFYALEYIENEIRKADYYFESPRSSLGIVIVYDNSKSSLSNGNREEYEYVLFNFENHKIIRNTLKMKKLFKVTNERYESNNVLLSSVENFKVKLNARSLEIIIKNKKIYFEKNIAIRAKKI